MIQSSMKETWDEQKKARFERTLLSNGWEVYQELKKSTIFQKYTARIEVDAFGCWLFEAVREAGGVKWVRTQGVSDDLLDRNYAPGYDPNIILFKHNRTVKRFDLFRAEWIKRT